MPMVRILSGNQKGAVVDMDQATAESTISFGFAEAYVEPVKVAKKPDKAKKPNP